MDGFLLSQKVNSTQVLCSVEGCTREKYRYINEIPYCNKHRMQIRQRGKILKRTPMDSNVFVFEGNDCKILLFDKHGNYKVTAVIDAADYETVKKYKWCLSSGRYPYSTVNGVKRAIHKLFFDFECEIDHKDGDSLNNRRMNLRECTHQQNICNQKLRVGTSSKYKGVSWNMEKRKWQCYITANKRTYRLGYFIDEKEAAKAYNQKAIELHGEFARLNPI